MKNYTNYNPFPARHLHFSVPAKASFESSSSHWSMVCFITMKTEALAPLLKRFQDQLNNVQCVALFSWLKPNMFSWFPCWLRRRPCIGFIRLFSLWIPYKVFSVCHVNGGRQISQNIQLSIKPTYNHCGPSLAFRAQNSMTKGEFLSGSSRCSGLKCPHLAGYSWKEKNTTAPSQSTQNTSKMSRKERQILYLPAMLLALKGEHKQEKKTIWEEGLAVKPAKCLNFITAKNKRRRRSRERGNFACKLYISCSRYE